jgi:hypothetical protein
LSNEVLERHTLFEEGDEESGFRLFGHPISTALGLPIFGLRKLWRLAELPSLVMLVRAQSFSERLLAFGYPVALLASGLIPGLVLRSVVYGVLSFFGFFLLTLFVMLPAMLFDMKRGLGPRGTYWDPARKQFRRERSLSGSSVSRRR